MPLSSVVSDTISATGAPARRWRILLTSCAVLAYGGEATPVPRVEAQEAQEFSACDLLTASDIEEVTGLAPDKAVASTPEPGVVECRWMTADGSTPLLRVAFRGEGAPLSYQAWMDEYRTRTGDEAGLASYELYSEVGDQFAVFSEDASPGGEFEMYGAGRALIIDPAPIEGQSGEMMALQLASRATSRMP